MPQPVPSRSVDEEKFQEYFRLLDQRIARLESHLGLPPFRPGPEITPENLLAPETAPLVPDGNHLELRFGEFGLSWIGSLILLLGIVFLIAYTYSAGQKALATLVGYSATALLYFIARAWRVSIPHLSPLMFTSSLLLLYYTTLRLHFYSANPIIGNAYAGLLILLLVVAAELLLVVRRGSQALSCLMIQVGLLAGLLSDNTHIILTIAALMAAVAAHLTLRRGWWILLNVTVVGVYLTHLLWLLNNPVTGHTLRAVSAHQYNLIYLFAYAGIFSIPVLKNGRDEQTDVPWVGTLLLNAAGFTLATGVVAFALFRQNYAGIYLAAAISCLTVSVIHWRKTHQPLAPALYACCGYLALSVAIYGYAGIPEAFLWLALESLLVVCMALWFRSRVLVVSNTFIYVCVLLAYLISSTLSNWVNFSFAIVALASARVMNWQRERLTLRTSVLRNIYLVMAFILVLYSLFHAVPSHYVTLTWTAAAVGYFALSILLRNIKYRWMAICTMIMTIFYLFFVDLARLAAVYRVAAFLFLGVMALVISLFYTKYKRLLEKTGN